MRHYLFALCLTTSACVAITATPTTDNKFPVPPANPCEKGSAKSCAFFNAPVELQPKIIRLKARPLPFFRTAKTIEFVDARPVKWVAPRNTLTDGASIPTLFLSSVGNPRSKEFLTAATLHDAYCGIGNENLPQYHSDRWQNVHRMFYDALRVSGTPPTKAKIMYAAVYLGGPRWYMPGEAPTAKVLPGIVVVNAPLVQGPTNTPLPRIVPKPILIEEMKAAIKYIKTNNPSFQRLESYLKKREIAILSLQPDRSENNTISTQETHGDGFSLN